MATILGDPEALIAEVSRRAHHKAVEIEEDARRHSAALLKSAAEESESIRQQSAYDAERQAVALARRNAARAELEAQRRIVLLREQPIDRTWREAEKRLRDLLRQPDYLDVLKRYALAAARELGAGPIVLAVDPIGHALLSAETLERWSKEAGVQFLRAPEPAGAWGGLLATSGRNRLDFTFATRLASAQAKLRERVFAMLNQGTA